MAAEIVDAARDEWEDLPAASMRPRRMAAEISANEPPRQERQHASMRPRRMAAEITAAWSARVRMIADASMRPRRMAAEIGA